MKQFTNIQDAHNNMKKELSALFRSVGIQVFDAIIIPSPVKTGRFRANWQASINEIKTGTLFNGKKVKKEDLTVIPKAENMLAGNISLKDILYLTNNLPYAEALEYGWSQKVAAHWVRDTVAKAQVVLDKKVRELIDNGGL